MEQIILGLEYVLEILVSEFLFLYSLKRQDRFQPKLIAVFGAICLAFVLLPNLAYVNSHMWAAVAVYVILFSLTIAGGCFLFRVSIWDVLFCCVAGYLTQHFGFKLRAIVLLLLKIPEPYTFRLSYWLLTAVIFCAEYYLVWRIFARKIRNGDCGNLSNRTLITLCVGILLLVIGLSILTGWGTMDTAAEITIDLYACLGCTLALVLQFGLLDKSGVLRELETTQQLIRQKQKQYEISRETIEFIDMLCHDLRFQLSQTDGDIPVSRSYLKTIEQAVDRYDAIAKTGNQTLDVILTESSLQCERKHIKLTSMVDGSCLNFMEATELYSLFGNALSNAIEGTESVSEPEKRYIGLTVKRNGRFVSIQVENYFEGTVTMVHGIPQTTKEAAAQHGFGIKSMQLIAQKYGGSLSAQTHGSIFTLNVFLLPPQ